MHLRSPSPLILSLTSPQPRTSTSTPSPTLNSHPLTRCILLAASLRQHGAPKLRVLSLGHSISDSGGAALAAALRGGGAPLLREVCISSSHLQLASPTELTSRRHRRGRGRCDVHRAGGSGGGASRAQGDPPGLRLRGGCRRRRARRRAGIRRQAATPRGVMAGRQCHRRCGRVCSCEDARASGRRR